MYWGRLAHNFNRFFSATPVHDPTLPGAGPVPSLLPRMVGYFANKTIHELSVNSLWPKPCNTAGSYVHLPAVIFNVRFDASKSPDMPFSEHWRNRSELERLARTFWNMAKMLELESERSIPRFDLNDMGELLLRTGLGGNSADEWFINFQRDYFALHSDDFVPSLVDKDGNPHHADHDEEMTNGNDLLDTTTPPQPLPFRPFVEKVHGTENGILEYQSITAEAENYAFTTAADANSSLEICSFEELRFVSYKQREERESNDLSSARQQPPHADREEEEGSIPSVFQELLRAYRNSLGMSEP